MTLTATIKDTGDDVTCICETDGNRKTFRVTLKDFIDSISSTETHETLYYDPINNIPDEVISFRLAKNRSLFSAKVIIQKKACASSTMVEMYLISPCQHFYLSCILRIKW